MEEATAFLSKCRTVPLDPQSVPCSLAGLKVFAQASAWKHVVEMSGKLLAQSESSTENGLSFVLRTRFEGLFRMKMFDELTHEVTRILEQEAAKSNKNMDVVLALRLLIAEILSLTGRGEEALTELTVLKRGLGEGGGAGAGADAGQGSNPLWLWRTKNSIVNVAMRMRLWRTAIGEMTGMISEVEAAKADEMEYAKAEIVLLGRLSRAMLQIGAVKAGVAYFQKAKERLEDLESRAEAGAAESDVAEHVQLTSGLVLFSQGNFEEAFSTFGAILSKAQGRQSSDTSAVVLDASEDSSNNRGKKAPVLCSIELEESLLAVAVNNFAVTALHLRKMNVSVSKLESLIREDPVRYLSDPVVFNLSTLYELSCSPEVSTKKKLVLKKCAEMYLVDDGPLNWRSFRL